MSQEAADASETPVPRIVGADGLTNKERRKLKQAEKRKRVEEGEAAPGAASKEDVETTATTQDAPQASAERKERKGKRSAAAAEAQGGEDAADAEDQDGEGDADGEVEALSHKERRKRRKMEKKGILPTAQGDSGTGAPSKPQEALLERSPWAVWVGNMSFSTTTQKLQAWLEEKGIQGISRVHMPKGAKKFEFNKGFAYVDLPSDQAVKDAVALSEDHLDGRRLLIKASSDFTGRPAIDPTVAALARAVPGLAGADASDAGAVNLPPSAMSQGPGPHGKTGLTKTAQKILRSQKHPAGPTLFVGNLSFNSTQEGLQDLFERSAKGREAWTKSAREKKREDKREKKIQAAIQRRKDRKADSDKDSDSDSDSSDDEEAEKSPKAVASGSGSGSGSDSESSSSSDSDSDSDDGEAAVKPKRKDEDQIRGAGARKVRMGTFEDTGKCKGFAFVDFHTPAYATASLIDPRNYRLDGRELTLEFAGADAVRRGAPKSAKGNWPSSRDSLQHKPGGRGGFGGSGGRGGRGGGRGGLRSGGDRPPRRDYDNAGDAAGHDADAGAGAGGEALPVPTSTNPNHKETQAERRARREREGKSGAPTRRAKPGAALANAQRGKVGIDLTGEAGKKTTFE